MECEVCGNESDDTFQIVRHVGRHTFDTFECAIYAMAPVCARCRVRVIGHPVIEGDHTFCCSHCAEAGPRQRHEEHGEEEEEEEGGGEEEEEGEGDEEEGEEQVHEEDEEEGGGEEQEQEGREGGDQPSDEELEKLDERISQARQGADDLLSSPEDEVDQDQADVEPEAEVGEEETGERHGRDDEEEEG